MSLAEVEGPAAASPVAPRPRPGGFRRLVGSEIHLVLRRRRNQALLLGLAVIPLLVGIAVKLDPPQGPEGPPFLGQVTGNGLFLAFTGLAIALPFFLPLVVGVVSGDSVAGEAGGGTLRYLLTVPVPRTRLLAAKALSVLAYTAAAVGTVAVVGLLAGVGLFGLHDVVLLSGTSVSAGNGLLRALGIVAYLVVALFGLSAGGLFLSTLTENPIGATAGTVALAILFEVLDAVPQLHAVQPYLLTHHWLGFGELLRASIAWGDLLAWTGLHLAYAVVFLSLAWARLTTKDVTS